MPKLHVLLVYKFKYFEPESKTNKYVSVGYLQSFCKHHIWGGVGPYSKIYGRDGYRTWKTEGEFYKMSVRKIQPNQITKLSVQHLIIRYWEVASMATETFWMPNSPHATQVSSMANFIIATSTCSTRKRHMKEKYI